MQRHHAFVFLALLALAPLQAAGQVYGYDDEDEPPAPPSVKALDSDTQAVSAFLATLPILSAHLGSSPEPAPCYDTEDGTVRVVCSTVPGQTAARVTQIIIGHPGPIYPSPTYPYLALTGSTNLTLLSALDELEVLIVLAYGGGLQATLPADWPEKLPKLQVLKLSDWRLGSIPPSWFEPSAWNLTQLWLNSCGLSGTLPASMYAPGMRDLQLVSNSLAGTLPAGWGSALGTTPYFGVELISGGPDADKQLSISLWGNRLTGKLPSEWGSGLQQLTQLNLQYNNLTGSIPPSWAQMAGGLGYYVLANNQLSGTIPLAFARRTASQEGAIFLLEGNEKVCGPIPRGVQIEVNVSGTAYVPFSNQSYPVNRLVSSRDNSTIRLPAC